MSGAADRNLLLGIIALQMDFITKEALIAAMHAWVVNKSLPLSQVLQDQGALSTARRLLLDALVEEHIKVHNNDAQKSLAAVSSIGSVREELSRIADPDLQSSLPFVSTARKEPDDPFRTVAPSSLGESTSTGSRFRILRPHAKGGLGQVSVAIDQELDRPVALKEIQDRHADDPASRARFVQEAEITGKLDPSLEGLRTKFLRRSQEFYRKLESLLKGQTDRDSLKALAWAYFDLGKLTAEIGDKTGALAAYERALSIRQALADAHPESTDSQGDLASTHNNIGLLLFDTSKPSEAMVSYESAMSIKQRLADAHPESTDFQSDLASTHNNIGILLSKTGKPSESLVSFEKARSIRKKLVDAHPAVTQFQSDLARSLLDMSAELSAVVKPAEALAAAAEARSVLQRLAEDHPTVTRFQSDLALSHNNIGALLSESGKPSEALASFERGLSIKQRLADAHPETPGFLSALGSGLNNMAAIDMAAGRWGQAYERLTRAIQVQRMALRTNPKHPEYRRGLRTLLNNFAQTNLALRKLAEAEATALELVTLSAGQTDYLYNGACWLARCVPLAADAAEAGRYIDESMAALRAAVTAGYFDGSWMSRDTDLSPLHGRDDFHRLVLDLMDRALPADPFAR
jgi:tetratricopeptide (TPR) repeat protein